MAKDNGFFKRTFKEKKAEFKLSRERSKELKALEKKELFEQRKEEAKTFAKKKATFESERKLQRLKKAPRRLTSKEALGRGFGSVGTAILGTNNLGSSLLGPPPRSKKKKGKSSNQSSIFDMRLI